MNYVILKKARPYTRTRRGHFERVSGYESGHRMLRPIRPRSAIGENLLRQIEENKTSAPKSLKPETRKSINRQLNELGTHHDAIPYKQISSIIEAHGLKILDEEKAEWTGFFVGATGEAKFEIAPMGSKKVYTSTDTRFGLVTIPDFYVYEPMKNAILRLSWYKMDSGRYEILSYIS